MASSAHHNWSVVWNPIGVQHARFKTKQSTSVYEEKNELSGYGVAYKYAAANEVGEKFWGVELNQIEQHTLSLIVDGVSARVPEVARNRMQSSVAFFFGMNIGSEERE
jgi:hypothetical protein